MDNEEFLRLALKQAYGLPRVNDGRMEFEQRCRDWGAIAASFQAGITNQPMIDLTKEQ